MTTFVIHGPPVPKGRRAFVAGKRAMVTLEPKSRSWEGAAAAMIAAQWGDAEPLEGPCWVRVWAVAKRPKRLQRRKDPDGALWRTTPPDSDNVLKSACDALTKAGVIRDDRQLVEKLVQSLYAEKGSGPRVLIRLGSCHAEGPVLLVPGREGAA